MQSHSISSPQEFWSGSVQPRLALIRNIRVLDSSKDGIAQAHQAIEDELAAVHLAICALHTERNALVWVCRLPSEILSRIFLFCANMSWAGLFRSNSLYTTSVKSLEWMVVTHVCKHWRETALHYPHLWSHIDFWFNAPCLRMTLSRAKSVPLSINFRSIALAAHGPEVSNHVSRIRDLSLTADSMDESSWEPIFQSMITYPARSLQHLTLKYEKYLHMPLPEDIFQSHAPLLRSIDLHHAYIPWSAPILCNLTHLKVTLDQGHWPRTSSDGLLDALRRMPALETLALEYCLPSRGNDGSVHLPSLRSLYMDDETTRCSYLTRRLCIPSSCALSLICTSDEPEEGNWPSEQMKLQAITEVISLFHMHVNREQAPLQSLALDFYAFGDGYVVTFSLSRTAEGRGSAMYTLQLPGDWRMLTDSIWDVEVAAVFSELYMGSIRHIDCMLWHGFSDPELNPSVLDAMSPPPDHLLGMLRRAHALETLKVRNFLHRGTRDFANNGNVALPCLKTLEIGIIGTSDIGLCSALVRRLRLPSSCSLDLDFNLRSADELVEAISMFGAHANREHRRAHLQSLRMVQNSFNASIQISRSAGDGETEFSHSLRFPRLHDGDYNPHSPWSPVAALLHRFSIEHIRHLELEWSADSWARKWTPAPENWLDVLGRCRAVEDVQFTGGHEEVLVFCTALAMPMDKKGTPSARRMRRLTLKGINFRQSDSDKARSFYSGLQAQLEARQKRETVHTVCIHVEWIQETCEQTFVSAIKRLKDFVPEIVWTKSDGTTKMWRMEDRDEDDSDYDDRF